MLLGMYSSSDLPTPSFLRKSS